jgi:nucleoid-associated protein YgaU
MTRETKIGLLVGLAFIIVIGILLSEHVSSTSEPQQAALNSAGTNVRDGVATPGSSDDGPPITIAGAPVEAPRQHVPTNADLHPPVPQVAYVPPGGAGRPTRNRPAPDGNPATLAAGMDGASAGPAPVSTLPPGRPMASTGSTGSPQSGPRQAPATPPVTYVAVSGDSVSRIASRLMGGNNKANRELLVRANPSLQNDGNVVVIGRTYVIPKATSTDSANLQQASLGQAQADPRAAVPASAAAAPSAHGSQSEPTRWYTVKGDDNLWRIAASQLGSGTDWTKIRDLNKDILNGSETVHPNMRLRLPTKTTVAGAD